MYRKYLAILTATLLVCGIALGAVHAITPAQAAARHAVKAQAAVIQDVPARAAHPNAKAILAAQRIQAAKAAIIAHEAHVAHLAHLARLAALAHAAYLARLAAAAYHAPAQAAAAPARRYIAPVAHTYSAPVSSGTYSYAGLEALWTSAGGPAWAAAHAASIAECESGGRTSAYNPSGATGLWQILGAVVPGNLYNAFTNALNAVAKFRASGGTFAQWVCR